MLDYNLDQDEGILSICPMEKMTSADFEALTTEVDAYLSNHDSLTGLLLTIEHVPSWENFARSFGTFVLFGIIKSESPAWPS